MPLPSRQRPVRGQRGKFFSGPGAELIYMTAPGYFFVLLPALRELTDVEADDLVRQELLHEQSFEVHALAVEAERRVMLRPLHPEVDPQVDVAGAVDGDLERRRFN